MAHELQIQTLKIKIISLSRKHVTSMKTTSVLETKPNDNGKYFRNFKMNHESVKCEENLNVLVAHFKWKILLGVFLVWFGGWLTAVLYDPEKKYYYFFWEHQK